MDKCELLFFWEVTEIIDPLVRAINIIKREMNRSASVVMVQLRGVIRIGFAPGNAVFAEAPVKAFSEELATVHAALFAGPKCAMKVWRCCLDGGADERGEPAE